MYDPALGRWHVVDPLAENDHSFSPFVYCANNPTRYVDPNGMWFDEANERKAERTVRKTERRGEKLDKRAERLEAKGKDASNLRGRSSELREMGQDIKAMGMDDETEYRYVSANSSSNPESRGIPHTDGMGTNTVTMYVDKGSFGNVVHETKHGGDIARGTMTESSYGVQDEVSAYRAQYAYDGSLPYNAADALQNLITKTVFEFTGSLPVSNVTNIGEIDAKLVDNIGQVRSANVNGEKRYGLAPLYPPDGLSKSQWDNN